MNFDTYVETTFLAQEELIDNSAKTKSLNGLKFKLDSLVVRTEDRRLLSKIASIYLLLEDAYNISMYKFQFKTFILSLSKEIKNIEDYIGQL